VTELDFANKRAAKEIVEVALGALRGKPGSRASLCALRRGSAHDRKRVRPLFIVETSRRRRPKNPNADVLERAYPRSKPAVTFSREQLHGRAH
jgi:hypothetical protein